MKKGLLFVLLLMLFIGLTACITDNANDSNNEDSNNDETKIGIEDWPTETFFDNIPHLANKVSVNVSETDKGSRYVISTSNISYKKLRTWIYKLEEAGYHYTYVDAMFPEDSSKLPKEVVSWSTQQLVNGVYISVLYYTDDSYGTKDDVIITIMNYDPLH